MDQLFESGLFSELGEVVGYDPVLYEDTPKQYDFITPSSNNGYGDGMDCSNNDGGLQTETSELDSLLAENNQLVEQLMSANGLDLPTEGSINLAEIDEVSANFDYLQSNIEQHVDLLQDLGCLSAPDDYPLAASPTSPIPTLPSEPSSPIDLLPFIEPEYQEHPQPAAELTDLLQSLIDDNDNTESPLRDFSSFIDEPAVSPVSSEESYSTSFSQSYTDESWNDDAVSSYSSEEVEVAGKSKGKRKSKSTPYSKLPAGRKERKKKQNKEAAIRYREKKRKEAQEIMGEEDVLAKKNNELKTEVLNLEREIACMKELLSDVFNIHSL